MSVEKEEMIATAVPFARNGIWTNCYQFVGYD